MTDLGILFLNYDSWVWFTVLVGTGFKMVFEWVWISMIRDGFDFTDGHDGEIYL